MVLAINQAINRLSGMATSHVIYFNGTNELGCVTAMRNELFAARFPGVKGKRYDSFSMWVGLPVDAKWDSSYSNFLPVQRTIFYKKFASKHECNGKCLNGKHDGACECKCGGKNHGLGSLLGVAA
jgi:hypothetical protein